MEVWKDIPGTNGIYQVSSLGNVRSIDRIVKHNYGGTRTAKGRTLRLSKQTNGYLACPVFYNGKEKRCNVHRLVMLAFVGESKLTVNHINGNKQDNRLENLEYCTLSQNLKHAFKNGLSCIDGERHPISKLSNEQARDILKSIQQGAKTTELAKKYNVVPSTISNLKHGRSYARAV